MDENRPLDIFLQPSRRLLLISLIFMMLCGVLLWTIPLLYLHKLLLFTIMLVGTLMELRSKVFLTSPNSIIRIGCDGGLMDAAGNVSETRWWYQRRLGAKIDAPLCSGSRVWAEWVALDFGRWPWQFGQAVVIARDSVEDPNDFQRLKRMLRSR
jgi:hypothetical protein